MIQPSSSSWRSLRRRRAGGNGQILAELTFTYPKGPSSSKTRHHEGLIQRRTNGMGLASVYACGSGTSGSRPRTHKITKIRIG